jgi:arginine decarboxylase
LEQKSNDTQTWSTADAAELYRVEAWGNGYFDINDAGHMVVCPEGPAGQAISLCDLVEHLQKRGYMLPFLVRFPEVLKDRVAKLYGSFQHAIDECGYRGSYQCVYPIKVNQQRDVVEELLEFGNPYRVGLEAGSKPELLVALALMEQPDGVIVCNGYKDTTYVETCLLAQKLGRHPIIVIDRCAELEMILRASKRLNLRPHLGVRVRLTSKGSGKWVESAGDRSKFGLTASEVVRVVERLREADMLDCLEMMHFHIGSQITSIGAIKDALKESSRVFAEIHQMGAGLRCVDVGGGLGVDYDGTQTTSHSSTNYSLQEYANDVVDAIQTACDEKGISHPVIISESGRALVAYHSILVFDVLDTARVPFQAPPASAADHDVPVVRWLNETWHSISPETYRESYHDAVQLKEEASNLFNLGYLDLPGRALVENIFWAICHRVHQLIGDLEPVPEELAGLEKALADTFYCNLSIFQSVPDHWAVKQLFPVAPIHRLHEQPTRRATLADLTCDSDGKVDRFIDVRGVKSVLELHEPNGEPYYLAMFLVGAYQEILGDLHNLFGDTTAIHVSLDPLFGYRIDRVVEGDSVNEVLGYVRYEKADLIRRVRSAAEVALRRGYLRMEESALLMKRFHQGLAGYTYLSREQEQPVTIPRAVEVKPPAPAGTPAKDPDSAGHRTPPAVS